MSIITANLFSFCWQYSTVVSRALLRRRNLCWANVEVEHM